jgi:cupin 2 domain-containing protein
MRLSPKSLLRDLPQPATGEAFEDLLRLGPVRIERIASSPFPEDCLYDQTQHEWVLLLQGKARLWVEGEEIALSAGDALYIPARTRHRVLATSEEPRCVWLAVHIEQPSTEAGTSAPP